MWPRGVVPTPSAEVRRAGVRPLLDGARPSAGAGLSRVGRDVGEEVSGGARRGPGGGGIGTLGREPEMGEDPADHPGILNGCDQAHPPPTARTREHEHPPRSHAATARRSRTATPFAASITHYVDSLTER